MSESTKQTASWFMDTQETSNGVIVKLYSSHPQVVHPIVKLYDSSLENPSEDLKEIPPALLKRLQLKGVSDNISDPLKEVALAKGWLTPIDPEIEFYVQVKDNKTTKRVDWEATKEAWAGGGQAGNASGGQLVYEGFVVEKHEALVDMIVLETTELGCEALRCVREWRDLDDKNNFTADELFKLAFYRVTKMFDSVRGAWLKPIEGTASDSFDVILNGTIETFAADLVAGHYMIENQEAVRGIIDDLGIKITKVHAEDVSKRVEVAQKVWLYVDLTSKYGKSAGAAKEVIDGLFEEVPW